MPTLSRRSLLALALLGCRRRPGAPARARAAPARRVVSLAPTATESLVAMGFADRLVAVSSLCHGPAGLPRVGTMVAPDAAAIASLRPDALVGVEGPVATTTLGAVLATGIRRVFPRAETLDEYLRALDDYAALVGAPSSAGPLRRRITEGAARVSRAVAGRPRPKVLAVYTASPLVVAGPGSWVDAALRAAGADNAAQSANRHPMITPEQARAWDPSLVLDLTVGGTSADVTGALTLAPDDGGVAVPTPSVVRVDGELVRRQGPRFAEAVAAIARAVHPGVAL